MKRQDFRRKFIKGNHDLREGIEELEIFCENNDCDYEFYIMEIKYMLSHHLFYKCRNRLIHRMEIVNFQQIYLQVFIDLDYIDIEDALDIIASVKKMLRKLG